MKVKQIYKEYMVPQNLQEHMIRVAALAEIILAHWTSKKVDKKAVVHACLFHDIAKPMTFDPSKQTQFGMPPKNIAKLKELQKRIKEDYGTDEHHATVKICEDIGLISAAVKLVDNLEWKRVPKLLKENDIESLIPIYCDMRIGPKGILSLEERLKELKERVSVKDYADNVKNGTVLEQLIRTNAEIDLNSVSDIQLNNRFKKLLNTEI